jgi:hypothetical protein
LVCHDSHARGPRGGFTQVARARTASEGRGFHRPEAWQRGGESVPVPFCRGKSVRFGLADFDGDGRDDAWCFDERGGRTFVALSMGSASAGGFTDPYNAVPTPWLGADGGWCAGAPRSIDFGTGDFNADGFADLYCRDRDTGEFFVAMGRGEYRPAGFVPNGQPTGGFRFVIADDDDGGTLGGSLGSTCGGRVSVGDFDGDGRSDVACHDGTTLFVQKMSTTITPGANAWGDYRCCARPTQHLCDALSTMPDYAQVRWRLGAAHAVLRSWCAAPSVFGASDDRSRPDVDETRDTTH